MTRVFTRAVQRGVAACAAIILVAGCGAPTWRTQPTAYAGPQVLVGVIENAEPATVRNKASAPWLLLGGLAGLGVGAALAASSAQDDATGDGNEVPQTVGAAVGSFVGGLVVGALIKTGETTRRGHIYSVRLTDSDTVLRVAQAHRTPLPIGVTVRIEVDEDTVRLSPVDDRAGVLPPPPTQEGTDPGVERLDPFARRR